MLEIKQNQFWKHFQHMFDGRASRAPEGASPAVFVPSLHAFFKELVSNLTDTVFVDLFVLVL